MVDVQTVSIAIASAGVFAAAIYYILQLRHQTRLREMDLIMRVDSKYADKIEQCWQIIRKTEFKNFDDFEEKCPLEAAQLAGFFDSLGLLLRRGVVDIVLISQLFHIEHYWQKMKLWVEGIREMYNSPGLYYNFEYIYNEWKKHYSKWKKREQQLAEIK